MLTYEHINYLLGNFEWVQEMRQDQLNNADSYKNYLEMSITIISGAIAGNIFRLPMKQITYNLILLEILCRFDVLGTSYTI